MTKRGTGNPLPTPPPGWSWQTGQENYGGGKTTFHFTLYDIPGNPRGSGRIAIELYGWDAATARATTLIREATNR